MFCLPLGILQIRLSGSLLPVLAMATFIMPSCPFQNTLIELHKSPLLPPPRQRFSLCSSWFEPDVQNERTKLCILSHVQTSEPRFALLFCSDFKPLIYSSDNIWIPFGSLRDIRIPLYILYFEVTEIQLWLTCRPLESICVEVLLCLRCWCFQSTCTYMLCLLIHIVH